MFGIRKLSSFFKRRSVIFLVGILAGTLLMAGGNIVSVSGSDLHIADYARETPFPYEDLWILREARWALETRHVDDAETMGVTEEDLLFGAIGGMVSAWGDKYTRFLGPDELIEDKISTHGEYGGIGIHVAQGEDGSIIVISPIEGTPADREGIRPGDEIVMINDLDAKDIEFTKAIRLLRGSPDTKVSLGIRRDGDILTFDLTREVIHVDTVRHQIIPDRIGYVRISYFNDETPGDFMSSVDHLRRENVKGLILDLRNNPGGVLDSCIEVADALLDSGVIVTIDGRGWVGERVFRASPGVVTDLPVVILVNEGSASASEILAGALKDNARGIVVGKKTFGKGSVQSLYHLTGGRAALYITVARYKTPNGVVIDGKGLIPDVEVEESKDPVEVLEEDPQIQEAIRILHSYDN